MTLKIGILIFHNVEELDFVGPWEVFTMGNEMAKRSGKPALHDVFLVAEREEPIRCAKGMRVLPDRTLADCDALDVLLVPGGQGTRHEVNNGALLAWIAKIAEDAKWVTSVCTGAMLLTAAGPAKGKKVTTHWAFVETLRERNEASEVLTNTRYIRDGNVVTAAGVSAGIDMALWLTGAWHGPDFARLVQRGMEYEPAPPYAVLVPPE